MKPWKYGALLYLLIVAETYGKSFSLSPGISLSSASESDQLNSDGKNLLKQKIVLGFNLDAELRVYKRLHLLINGQWVGGEATSQYDFTDKENPLEHAQLTDMKSNYSALSLGAGARFRFLEIRGVTAFMGYLYSKGQIILSHDENKFLYNHYSKLGWLDREEQGFTAQSFELGLELFPAKDGKLHIIGRQNKFKTKEFETLSNRKLSFKNYQLLILYRHIF